MSHSTIKAWPLGAALLFAPVAQAGLISGFEAGLSGWDYIGDVSIQTSAIGLAPTQGQQMAFMSTMCDRNNPPAVGRCETTVNEHPYSGTSSSPAEIARQFLGLPAPVWEFAPVMPPISNQPHDGESGAMKLRFFAPQSGILSFDWNRIGSDGDSAYMTLWSDEPGNLFRLNDWVLGDQGRTFVATGVDLCSRYYDTFPNPACNGPVGDLLNAETGWRTKSVQVSQAGWYWLGLGMGEIREGTAPSVLAVDNVRFQVPEPGTLGLLAMAALGLAGVRHRVARRGR